MQACYHLAAAIVANKLLQIEAATLDYIKNDMALPGPSRPTYAE